MSKAALADLIILRVRRAIGGDPTDGEICERIDEWMIEVDRKRKEKRVPTVQVLRRYGRRVHNV